MWVWPLFRVEMSLRGHWMMRNSGREMELSWTQLDSDGEPWLLSRALSRVPTTYFIGL